jgi:hypothetical protein
LFDRDRVDCSLFDYRLAHASFSNRRDDRRIGYIPPQVIRLRAAMHQQAI